jgi:hypothetical protein
MMHPAFVSGDISSPSCLYRLNNCRQMSIRLCFSSSVFGIQNQQLSPACAHVKLQFSLICLLRNTTGLLSPAGCCSWSLTTLRVIRTDMSEVCIADTCSPTSNSNVATTIVPINNSNALMNKHYSSSLRISPGIKFPEREADYLSLSSAQVELYFHFTIHLHVVLLKHRDKFIFTSIGFSASSSYFPCLVVLSRNILI